MILYIYEYEDQIEFYFLQQLQYSLSLIVVCIMRQLTYIWSSLILPTAANPTERDIYAEPRHQLQIDPL